MSFGFRAIYCCIALFMWTVSILFSKEYFAHYSHKVRYYAFLLITMFAKEQSVFLMAIYNMCLILLPGLCLTGVNVILQNARNSRGWMGKISLLFLVAAVCCMGLSSLYFVALWGAYATIAAALHQKIMQKMKDQNEK